MAEFLSFPLPFVAIITGWFTAEVGRQPWVVYGVLRTADAMTPFLTTREATISLIIFCSVYVHLPFGTFYIYRLIRDRPRATTVRATASRGAKPADVVGRSRNSFMSPATLSQESSMVMFWVSLLAVSILLYVLLDGVDLGVGLLFGLANGEGRRGAMLSAVAPIWDGNETWLVVTAVYLVGRFPVVFRSVAVGFLSAVIVMWRA